MRHRSFLIAASLALAAVGGALAQTQTPTAPEAKAAAPAPKMLSVKDMMRHVLNPAADHYWANSGIVETEEGTTDRAPKDQAHWDAQINAAAVVMESGNLLLMEGRRREERVWITNSEALIKAGEAAMKASREKNAEAAFDAGSAMYEACFNCHGRYIPRRQVLR